jgi:uncharacterized protein
VISRGNYEEFLSFCEDDTVWTFVGEQTLTGKEEVRRYMEKVYVEPPKFDVETFISDGEYVTAVGKISMKDEHGEMIDYDYCDVWKFKNGKLSELKAFVIVADSAKD